MKKITTKEIVCVGMFAALMTVLSQISVPMPSGVPITLQTFIMAFAGVVLSWKLATASTVVYILLGAIGVPVFANFHGGVQWLLNYTGGFIWGFILLAALCGIGTLLENKIYGILLGLVGLAGCHLLGVLQFMIVTKRGFAEAALMVSVPYLVKDSVSVVMAFVIGELVRRRLFKANLLTDLC